MSLSPLTIIPSLSAVAITYRQDGLIADQVMPRVQVDKQQFLHLSDRIQDWITPPDTTVGRTSQVGQLASSIQDPTYLATVNQGLDELVPRQDDMNAPGESAQMRAVQHVMKLVQLRREVRVASIVNSTANYNNTVTLSGTSQWSDKTNSDPLSVLLQYLDLPFMRPNKLIMGRAVWTALSQHPKLVGTLTSADRRLTREQLAALLEIDDIIIGDGWYNTAAKGQTPVKARVWGKFCAGIYSGGQESQWGYTAQFGSAVAGTIEDSSIGLFGGLRVRAGESIKEVVAAPEFGFLIQNAVA